MIDFNEEIPKIYKSCDLNGIPEKRKLQKTHKNVWYFSFITKNNVIVMNFVHGNVILNHKIMYFQRISKNLQDWTQKKN